MRRSVSSITRVRDRDKRYSVLRCDATSRHSYRRRTQVAQCTTNSCVAPANHRSNLDALDQLNRDLRQRTVDHVTDRRRYSTDVPRPKHRADAPFSPRTLQRVKPTHLVFPPCSSPNDDDQRPPRHLNRSTPNNSHNRPPLHRIPQLQQPHVTSSPPNAHRPTPNNIHHIPQQQHRPTHTPNHTPQPPNKKKKKKKKKS